MKKKLNKVSFTCLTCGEMFTRFPCEIKKGTPKYCSAKCYFKTISGSGNPNWRGGIYNRYESIRKSKESDNWRKSVFERDNYTCQHCGDKKGRNLNAHHIIPFSKDKSLRFDISNGITLCNKCHRKEHTRLSIKRTKQLDIFSFQKGELYV